MIPDGFTVVAGSLGDQGGAVARTLKRHGRHVRALARDRRSPAAGRLQATGVEVLSDDAETPVVVLRDVAGAAHVFGAFTPFETGGLAGELRRVRNLAWASVRAGVEDFVCSTVADPDQDGGVRADELWGVERLLRQFELPLTLLRPAFLMEYLGESALRRDPGGGLVLRLPLRDDAVLPWIAVDDVAVLVRIAFDRPGALGSGPVWIGADAISPAQACALLGERLGEEVRYERIALGEVEDRHARGRYRWFLNHGEPDVDVRGLRRLHPGLMTFRQWLAGGRLDLDEVERESPAAA